MNETLRQLRQRALAVIEQAGDLAALEQARIDLLGKIIDRLGAKEGGEA